MKYRTSNDLLISVSEKDAVGLRGIDAFVIGQWQRKGLDEGDIGFWPMKKT